MAAEAAAQVVAVAAAEARECVVAVAAAQVCTAAVAGGTGISTATSRVVAVGRSSVGVTTGASGMVPEDGGSGAVSGTHTAWARAGSCRRSVMCGSAAEDRLRPVIARGRNGKTIRGWLTVLLIAKSGSRICNGLGIMRQCLEIRTLDQLGERLEQLESTRGVSYGTTKHDQPAHVAH